MKAIYLGSIIRGKFFGWQLFGSNYPGNSLSANCPRTNYLGGNYRGTNFWEVIVRGAITLGGQLYAGNCPGADIRGGGVIVLFPIKYVKGYDIETNDLNSDRSPENIAKSITDVASIQKMIDMMQAYQILLLTTQVNENLENCV